MEAPYRVAVLGGGISGLVAAWRLSARLDPRQIVVLEASDRLGGWIDTTQPDDGAVFEHGPRGIRLAGRGGKVALCLVEELGLANSLLPVTRANAAARTRLIYANGAIHRLPSSIGGALKTPGFLSEPLWKPLVRESTSNRRDIVGGGDVSVHEFFRNGFGLEVADMLVDPLCRGIFASSPKSLSARGCFPALWEYVRQKGSIIRGALLTKQDRSNWPDCDLVRRASAEKWQVQWTLENGLEMLPNRLGELLRGRGVDLRLGVPCTKLEFSENERVKIDTQDGNSLMVDQVISAIPSRSLASLLTSEHNSLREKLSLSQAVTVGVVSVEFSGHALPFEGFGYLVPSNQPPKILGVIFDSCGFPDQDRKDDKASTRLTVMLGGEWFDELFGGKDESYITSIALETLAEHLGIKAEPNRVITKIQRNCLPQYPVGHVDTLDEIWTYIDQKKLPLTLTGLSYKGVGLVDCIVNAGEAAETVAKKMNAR